MGFIMEFSSCLSLEFAHIHSHSPPLVFLPTGGPLPSSTWSSFRFHGLYGNMSMCIYVHICIYNTYVLTHICLCPRMYAYMCICIHACMHTCKHIHQCICFTYEWNVLFSLFLPSSLFSLLPLGLFLICIIPHFLSHHRYRCRALQLDPICREKYGVFIFLTWAYFGKHNAPSISLQMIHSFISYFVVKLYCVCARFSYLSICYCTTRLIHRYKF